MSEANKTEKATPRRIKQAREKGQVASSEELKLFGLLTVGVIFIMFFIDPFIEQIINIFQKSTALINENMDVKAYFIVLMEMFFNTMIFFIAATVIVSSLMQILQSGFNFSLKAAKPDAQKINPVKNFKNIFSRKKFVEMLKKLFVVSVLAFVTYKIFSSNLYYIAGSIQLPWLDSLRLNFSIFKSILLQLWIVFGIIGIVDYFYQRFEYKQDLRMSKNETKDEYKQTYGNPEVKQQQNKILEGLRSKDTVNRMKEATFVTVNPTHYSVALYYDPSSDNPPKVIAKGVEQLALQIRKLAKDNDVPIHEDPPLTRKLYADVEVDEYIPEEMFFVIIQVIDTLMKENKLSLDLPENPK